MKYLLIAPLAATVVIAAPVVLGAQNIGARIAPQIYSYKLAGPSNLQVSEFAVPLYVVIPAGRRLTVDIGTAFAQSKVTQAGVTSSISGVTDTQIRGNLTLGGDFVVITAGVNLPTGTATVSEAQQSAAALIGSDFLSFPISNMGSGFGGTGGIAIARPLGDWNVGVGASVRRSAAYDPFEATGTSAALRYRPGNEYRARLGADHPLGTGRMTFGFTYLTFGNDDLAGSIYNTGDRYLTQLEVDDSFGPGHWSLSAWNLYRGRGTIADGSLLDKENITNGTLSYSIPAGGTLIEPNVEGRTWTQAGLPTSYIGTFGLRAQFDAGAFSIVPSAGYSVGSVATVTEKVGLTGFRGLLTIRIR